MTELSYQKAGDYFVPEIAIRQTHEPLGKWGMMRRDYLREERPLLYSNLIMKGTLYEHLLEIQESARTRLEQMMAESLQKSPAPDKEKDQMGWVAHMNLLKSQAEEVIVTELITS